MNIEDFSNLVKNIRIDIIKMITEAKSGHPGGSLSIVDILTTLYFDEMKIDPINPKWEERDRFVLSKGHAAPALYAVLAHKGYFSKDILKQLRKCGSILQGHPDMKRTPGIDMSTGSLGQGLSAACGMALASKMDDLNYNVFALLGDGELQEGMIWEAAMFASQYKLDNLMAIVDMNGLQIDGKTDEVMSLGSISKKFTAFGWYVVEIDGHDFDQIFGAFNIFEKVTTKPMLVIANTVKGKGVSFMEDECKWHSQVIAEEDYHKAMEELR